MHDKAKHRKAMGKPCSKCSKALVLKVGAPGQQPNITWELSNADSQAPTETF